MGRPEMWPFPQFSDRPDTVTFLAFQGTQGARSPRLPDRDSMCVWDPHFRHRGLESTSKHSVGQPSRGPRHLAGAWRHGIHEPWHTPWAERGTCSWGTGERGKEGNLGLPHSRLSRKGGQTDNVTGRVYIRVEALRVRLRGCT